MIYYFDHFMQIWLLPPGGNLLLAVLGLLFWRHFPLLAKSLLGFSLISLWLLSSPFVTEQLFNTLQYQYSTLTPDQLQVPPKEAAIVVLDAGINHTTPEYNEPTVSEGTLTRLRYAAFLQQKTGMPILVSGHNPMTPSINDADEMDKALKKYFGVSATWKEDRGVNTAQEGILATDILKKAGIKKIYLVTHAFHMPRSMYAFMHKNIEIVPAPTGYTGTAMHLGRISQFLPAMDALRISTQALREYIGILWYQLHYTRT